MLKILCQKQKMNNFIGIRENKNEWFTVDYQEVIQGGADKDCNSWYP